MSTALRSGTTQEVLSFLVALTSLGKQVQLYGLDHPRSSEAHAEFERLQAVVSRIPQVRQHGLIVALHHERFFLENIPLPESGTQLAALAERFRDANAGGFVLQLPISNDQLSAILAELSSGRKPSVDGARGFDWITGAEVVRRERRHRLAQERRALLMNFPELQIDVETYHNAVETLASVSRDTVQAGAPVVEIVEATRALAKRLIVDPDLLLPMITVPYYDKFTHYHTVNTCLLTVKVARRLVDDPDLLERIAHAALLFDVGKSCLPGDLLEKTGELTPEEAAQVMEHPVTGALLLSRHPGIDPLAVNVAFGHHIKDGGGGYPKVSRGYRLDAVTRLVQVADIFEALIALRPHKRPLTGPRAFEMLRGMPNMESMQEEIRLLQEALGSHPPGTRVRLPDDRVALVVGAGDEEGEIRVRAILDTPNGAMLERPEWVKTADHFGTGAEALDPEAELDLLEAQH